MGLLDKILDAKIFDSKICCVCGKDMGMIPHNVIKDGAFCNECKKNLSPYHVKNRTTSLDDLLYEIDQRKENEHRLQLFKPTYTFGNLSANTAKIYIDLNNRYFAVCHKSDYVTGGEPFIYEDLIYEIISKVSKSGKTPTCITNGFWVYKY